MQYFIRNGEYMEGDMLPGDIEVTQRPSEFHRYENGEWVERKPYQIRLTERFYELLADVAINHPEALTVEIQEEIFAFEDTIDGHFKKGRPPEIIQARILKFNTGGNPVLDAAMQELLNIQP